MALTARDLTGIITPVLTLYTADGEIDEDALRRLVRTQTEAGIGGLFAMGSSGEFGLLTDAQRSRATEIIVEEALACVTGRSDVVPRPLIADVGTGSGCLAIAIARDIPGARVVATGIRPAGNDSNTWPSRQ